MDHITGGWAAPTEAASITSPQPRTFLEGPLPGLRSGAHALSAFLGPPVAASKHPGLHMERVDVITVILFKGNEFLRCPAN